MKINETESSYLNPKKTSAINSDIELVKRFILDKTNLRITNYTIEGGAIFIIKGEVKDK